MIRCHWWKTTQSWMKPVGLGFDGWLQQECQHHFAGCHSVKGVFIKPSSLKREGSVGSLTQLFLSERHPGARHVPVGLKSWREGLHSSLSFPTESLITLYMQKCGKMLVTNAGKVRGLLPKFMIHFLIEKPKWSLNKSALKMNYIISIFLLESLL